MKTRVYEKREGGVVEHGVRAANQKKKGRTGKQIQCDVVGDIRSCVSGE